MKINKKSTKKKKNKIFLNRKTFLILLIAFILLAGIFYYKFNQLKVLITQNQTNNTPQVSSNIENAISTYKVPNVGFSIVYGQSRKDSTLDKNGKYIKQIIINDSKDNTIYLSDEIGYHFGPKVLNTKKLLYERQITTFPVSLSSLFSANKFPLDPQDHNTTWDQVVSTSFHYQKAYGDLEIISYYNSLVSSASVVSKCTKLIKEEIKSMPGVYYVRFTDDNGFYRWDIDSATTRTSSQCYSGDRVWYSPKNNLIIFTPLMPSCPYSTTFDSIFPNGGRRCGFKVVFD